MKPNTAHLIYFSPTGTTRKVLRCIAAGIGVEDTKEVNLTLPHSRQGLNDSITTDLLLLGVPVYEEHIPPIVRSFIETLSGYGQNAIVVAVFGNVGYGLVLQEMEKLLTSNGFNVIAGAAFIGEHSYSHTEFPIAHNRPDETDLEIAIDFGRKIAEKLSSRSTKPRTFPGHLPLLSRILPEGSAANFAELPRFEPALCIHCNQCAENCPANAIDFKTMAVDGSKCLRCFACVRICSRNARSLKLKHAWLVKRVLKKAAMYRQEPCIFL